MTTPSEQTIALLTRIAVAVEKMAASVAKPTSATIAEVAPDAELDGQFGDVEVKKDPPRWTGDPVAPCRMSQGTPDWLDSLASFYDWKADKDEESGAVDAKGRPKAHWSRKDAARARGWSARLRKEMDVPAADAEPRF